MFYFSKSRYSMIKILLWSSLEDKISLIDYYKQFRQTFIGHKAILNGDQEKSMPLRNNRTDKAWKLVEYRKE